MSGEIARRWSSTFEIGSPRATGARSGKNRRGGWSRKSRRLAKMARSANPGSSASSRATRSDTSHSRSSHIGDRGRSHAQRAVDLNEGGRSLAGRRGRRRECRAARGLLDLGRGYSCLPKRNGVRQILLKNGTYKRIRDQEQDRRFHYGVVRHGHPFWQLHYECEDRVELRSRVLSTREFPLLLMSCVIPLHRRQSFLG